jgi:hypothetical protein
MATKNLDKQTLSEMDTIGSYFVNLFCFEHKATAKNLAATKNMSATSAYHTTLTMYVQSLSDDRYYKQAVMLFHEYSNKHRSQMTFNHVEDRLVSKFIPADYYGHFSNSRREQTLREIFTSTARHLADWFIQHTDEILENQTRESVQEYQEIAVAHLKMLRDNYYTKFAKEIIGGKTETVDADQYKKIAAELIAEKRARGKLEGDLLRAQHIIRGLTQAAENLAREMEELKRSVRAPESFSRAPESFSRAPALATVVVSEPERFSRAPAEPPMAVTVEKRLREAEEKDHQRAQEVKALQKTTLAPTTTLSDWCEEVAEAPAAAETEEAPVAAKVYEWGDDVDATGW